jgi:hypothetical protein
MYAYRRPDTIEVSVKVVPDSAEAIRSQVPESQAPSCRYTLNVRFPAVTGVQVRVMPSQGSVAGSNTGGSGATGQQGVTAGPALEPPEDSQGPSAVSTDRTLYQ